MSLQAEVWHECLGRNPDCLPWSNLNRLKKSSGCFPGQLKEARVTPLFKHVFADDPNNYRPISVLPTISKLFEKVVCSQFYDFLSRFKLLHGKQSGFRPKHSCQTSACRLMA
jgi:hypothetical protein